MPLEQYLQAAPKAELHIHLEGAIQPATAIALARRNKIPLPVDNAGELRQRFTYRDFDHFVEAFMLVTRCLKTREDYEQIVYELGATMAQQNIRYAEVTVTPSTHYLLGVPHEIYFSGMQSGRARARTDFNVEINWIFNIVRQWADATRTWPMADYVTSVAIEGKDDGVVALGLAGAEAGAPPEPFAPCPSHFDHYMYGQGLPLPISAFQYTNIVRRQRATTIKLCQQLLLINHTYLSRGAGHLQSTRTHREILAQRLSMTIHIKDTQRPERLTYVEVLATKVKERYMILHRRQHIGDQRQDM
jgi:hypothetical protein